MKKLQLTRVIKRSTQLSVALLAASAMNVFAAGPEVNVNDNDVAIHGYDPVAYHIDSKPKQGKAKYSAVYNDAIYYFNNADNRDAFKNNPASYAPAFGGYCAMGVALQKKFDGDPKAWKIVDGTLYLNLNQDIQKKWLENVSGNVETANVNWPEIKFSTSEFLADL